MSVYCCLESATLHYRLQPLLPTLARVGPLQYRHYWGRIKCHYYRGVLISGVKMYATKAFGEVYLHIREGLCPIREYNYIHTHYTHTYVPLYNSTGQFHANKTSEMR